MRYPNTKLCEAISFLRPNGAPAPSNLRLLSALDIESCAPPFEPTAMLRTVWMVVRLAASHPSSANRLIYARE